MAAPSLVVYVESNQGGAWAKALLVGALRDLPVPVDVRSTTKTSSSKGVRP